MQLRLRESKSQVCWWGWWCEWDAAVCLSVPRHVKTLWQSSFFPHANMMTITTPDILDCTRAPHPHQDYSFILSRRRDWNTEELVALVPAPVPLCWSETLEMITKGKTKLRLKHAVFFFFFNLICQLRPQKRVTATFLFISGSRWKGISAPVACVPLATPLC